MFGTTRFFALEHSAHRANSDDHIGDVFSLSAQDSTTDTEMLSLLSEGGVLREKDTHTPTRIGQGSAPRRPIPCPACAPIAALLTISRVQEQARFWLFFLLCNARLCPTRAQKCAAGEAAPFFARALAMCTKILRQDESHNGCCSPVFRPMARVGALFCCGWNVLLVRFLFF